jgi:integrase
MRKSRIKLKKFVNPGGTFAWRVSGTVNGKQERKNFKTKEEADEFKQQLEVKLLQRPEDGRFVFTKLSPEELDDAFAALKLLRERGSERSLLFSAQFLLENFKEAEISKPLQEAFVEYQTARLIDHERKDITRVHYNKCISRMKLFIDAVGPALVVATISTERIDQYLNSLAGGKPSRKYWNNDRGLINHFFGWCVKEKYIAENPVDQVSSYRLNKTRSNAKILSVDQVADIMAYAEDYPKATKKYPENRCGMLVPFISLAVFGGIRPSYDDGELRKMDPATHIDYQNGVIRVSPDIAKTHELRKVFIQPNLNLWHRKYPLNEYPIFPDDLGFVYAIQQLREKFKVPHDGFRRTFTSMLVGSFRSPADAAMQTGNSETVIRQHYLDLVSMEDADRFWRIVPKGCQLPELVKIREQGRFVIQGEREKYDTI